MTASPPSTAPTSPPNSARPRRDGFTLIEILMVILVIAILASLIMAVIGNSLNSARAAATRATLTKVHRLLEERRQAITRSDLRREVRVVRASMSNVPGLYTNDVAKIVALKEVMRVQLPQRIDDLRGADRLFGTADDSPVLKKLQQLTGEDKNNNGNLDPGEDLNNNNLLDMPFSTNPPTFPPTHDATTTSSELLYVALTMGTELGSGSSAIEFSSSEAVDTDGDGLMELVDGWARPLRFYRWPTSLVLATPNSTADTRPVELLIGGGNAQLWNSDPDDPLGRFRLWMIGPNVSNHPKVLNWFHSPATYHIPLVVSAGQDGQLGLEEPIDLGRHGVWARLYDEDEDGDGQLDSGEDRNSNGILDNLIQNSTLRIVLADNITNRNISIGGN